MTSTGDGTGGDPSRPTPAAEALRRVSEPERKVVYL